MREHGDCQGANVIGNGVVAPVERGRGFGGPDELQRGAGRCSETKIAVLSSVVYVLARALGASFEPMTVIVTMAVDVPPRLSLTV